MGKAQDEHKTEYDLDHLIQSAYGLSDDQILERMRIAEETVDDSQIPPEPEDGFTRLQEEIERRNLKPHFAEEYEKEREGERKVRALGPIVKVSLAVAVLATMLLMTSITAGAKRSYRYRQSTRDDVKNDVVFDNEMNVDATGTLEEAYNDIYEQLGINVLTLGYRPKEMRYLKTAINGRRATIYFDYKGNSFYIIQDLKTEENSSNIKSDRKETKSIYNRWFDRDFEIETAVTENGEAEYSVHIAQDNAYYLIIGIIEFEEFEKILKSLSLMEGGST